MALPRPLPLPLPLPLIRYEEALRQLADDVYYSSLMVGPEHIDTSGGYFQLGNVFFFLTLS